MISKKWHRILTASALAAAGLGGLMGATDPAGLGLTAHTWGIAANWVSILAAIIGIGITVARTLSDTE